jgi:nicotinamidase-related amidase
VIPDSQPYPWPWDARLDPRRLCLVIAGLQRVHADASPTAAVVVERIETLADALRAAGATVCHVRHSAPPAPGGRRPRPLLPRVDEPGWAPVIDPADDDLVVAAAGLDGFCGSSLDLDLRARGLDLVVAAGLAAEAAVSCTVRSANDRGYECLTLTDATAPLDPATGVRELHSITMSGGIFGAIGTAAALLDALGAAPLHGAAPR